MLQNFLRKICSFFAMDACGQSLLDPRISEPVTTIITSAQKSGLNVDYDLAWRKG